MAGISEARMYVSWVIPKSLSFNKMRLQELPVELFMLIIHYLTTNKDISSFGRCCRAIYAVVNPVLYRRVRDDRDVLNWAGLRGSAATVKKMLAAGSSPNTAYIEYSPEIPVTDYHLRLMLLDQQARKRFGDYERVFPISPGSSRLCRLWTPLHVAVSCAHNDIIDILLDHGADINALSLGFCKCRDYNRDSSVPWWKPLHTALCRGRHSSARLLIARGASFHVATRALGSLNNYVTALHISCSKGDIAMCCVLLDHYRPPLNDEDSDGLSPIAWAYKSYQWRTIEFVLEHRLSANYGVGNQHTLLSELCYYGRFAEIYRLLQLGTNVRGFCHKGSLYKGLGYTHLDNKWLWS
ncbi:ankyrin repeat-containing domain protein [Whalleya microplaca]|nr:ankyrin repeat-containing domain protein [Whalleya microplaca]